MLRIHRKANGDDTSHPQCALLAILLACSSMCAWSQTQLATVTGTITDPSGAVVPGVSVTIISQGTGFKRSALTLSAIEAALGVR